MIEVTSQAVPKTLKQHNFQDAFQNDRSAGEGAYARKGTSSRVMVASKAKVNILKATGMISQEPKFIAEILFGAISIHFMPLKCKF
jgi:hypothetical protein